MTSQESSGALSASARFNLPFIVTATVAAALGGLLFGYDWVVIGGAKPFFERFFNLSDPALRGWANSCALVGCLVGALTAGGLSDRYGRKPILILAALLFAGTSIGNAMAGTFTVFVLFRICGGIAIGLASSLSPMYIAEISPPSMRGKLVAVNQLTIVVGILLAQLVNWWIVRDLPSQATDDFIVHSWYGETGWRWMFGLTAIPSVLFFVSMLFVPESPRWLAKNGRPDEARRILARVGGEAYGAGALADIEATLVKEVRKVDFRELLEPRMRRVLVLGVVLAVFQQWCGINVIFNYAEEVFAAAGYRVSDIMFNIVITGTVNLVFTFIAIGMVDSVGRRMLMSIGAAALAVVYATIGMFFHSGSQGLHVLVLVLVAIGSYAMSLAPVTWVILSEIFPNRIRGAAMSVAVTSLWVACFILTYTYPILNSYLGPAMTFWIYGAVCVAGFLFIRLRLPETKGKSLEQLERELAGAPTV